MTTRADTLNGILQEVLDMTFDELETLPAVRAAWQEFKDLVSPLRARDNALGMAMTDAANDYATELATAAFLAGVAFDGRALLLQAARE